MRLIWSAVFAFPVILATCSPRPAPSASVTAEAPPKTASLVQVPCGELKNVSHDIRAAGLTRVFIPKPVQYVLPKAQLTEGEVLCYSGIMPKDGSLWFEMTVDPAMSEETEITLEVAGPTGTSVSHAMGQVATRIPAAWQSMAGGTIVRCATELRVLKGPFEVRLTLRDKSARAYSIEPRLFGGGK